MPSSVVRHPVGRSQSAFLDQPPSYRAPAVLINTLSFEAIGPDLVGFNPGAFTSQTYPAASRVLAYPFEIADPFLVRKVFLVVGTTGGTDSSDIGVYDEAGTTRLVSSGSGLIGSANTIQEKDCTDTMLLPGRYWCAYVQGGVTATPVMAPAAAIDLRAMGCAQMAGSGSTLGTTFTPAAIASANFPLFGIASRTVVT